LRLFAREPVPNLAAPASTAVLLASSGRKGGPHVAQLCIAGGGASQFLDYDLKIRTVLCSTNATE
jgi:hypothetical protein